MQDIATLGLALDSANARAGINDLKKLEQAGNKAADSLDAAGKKANNGLGSIAGAARAAQAALASLGVAAAIRQVVAINDAYSQVEGRLKLVTNGTAELAEVQERLFGVAQKTGASYEETANLYAKVAKNADELGLSQQQLLDFTTITNQAIQVSGASAIEAAGGVRQLGQALASGALRGDEFNSLAENMPRLRDAIADGLGISIGKLREFAAEGKLTADVVTKALLSQGAVIESEFASLPVTVDRAMTELENSVKRVIASADTTPLTNSIRELTKTLSDPQIMEGLTNIATVLVTIAKWTAQAAAGVSAMAQNVGELAAAVSLNADAWDVLRFLAFPNPVTIGSAISSATDQIVNGVAGVERTAREAAPAVAGFFSELDGLTKLAPETAIPLRDVAGLMVPFRSGTIAAAKATDELTKEQKKAAEAIKRANESAALANKVTERTIELAKLGLNLNEAETRAKMELDSINSSEIEKAIRLEKEKAALAKTQREVTQAYEDYIAALDKSAGSAEEELNELERKARETEAYNQLLRDGVSIDDARLQIERQFADLRSNELDQARQRNEELNITKRQLEEALGLQQQFTDETIAGVDAVAERSRETAAEINRSLTDALLRGFEDGKGFAENFADTLENMFKTLVLTPVIEPILQPLATALQGVISGVIDSIKSQIPAGGFGGISGTAFGTGAGLALASYQLGTALRPNGSNLSSGMYGGLTTLGGPLGIGLAGLDSVTGGSLFGTKWRTSDNGINLDFVNGDVEGQTFERQKKKRSLGRGTKRRTIREDLGDGTESLLQDQYDAFTQVLGGVADQLGLSADAIDTFVGSVSLSLKDMDAGEAEAAVNAAIRDMLGGLTDTVIPYLHEFGLANEETADTLVRVAANLTTVNAVLDLLDRNVEISGEGLLTLSEDLVDLFGGDSGALAQAAASFYDAFTSDSEKFSDLTESLTGVLADVNLALPATRDEFGNLIDGLDLTTESGREAFATLLRLAGQADTYYSEVERRAAEAAAEQTRLADEAMSTLTDSLSGYRDEFEDLSAAYGDAIKGVADTLEKALASIQASRNGLNGAIQTIRASAGFDSLGYQKAEIERLRASLGVGSIDEQVGTVNDLRDAIVERYNLEVQGIRSAESAAQQVYQQQMQQYESQRRALEDLKKYTDSLMLSDLTVLTPAQQLEEARRQFEAARGSGDIAGLQSASQTYLQQARDFYGSGGNYSSIFGSVTDTLRQVGASGPGAMPEIYTGAHDQEIADLQAQAVKELGLLQLNLDDAQAEAIADSQRMTEELTVNFRANTEMLVQAVTAAAAATAEKIGEANTAQLAQLKETTDILAATFLQGAAMAQANTNSQIAAASASTRAAVVSDIRNASLRGETVLPAAR